MTNDCERSSLETESKSSSNEKPQQAKRNVRIRIGIALILISGVLWFSLFAIPFLPLTVVEKSMLAGAMFVGVQIAWWSGAALAGPTVAGRITQWFRRSK